MEGAKFSNKQVNEGYPSFTCYNSATRVQDLLLSYAGRFLPSGQPPPKATAASHRYQR
jgi:hypothetical protein